MILAAGLATRLYPLSREVPKAALPVLNRPLAHYLLDWLRRHGTTGVAVNLHHLPDIVRRTFLDYPADSPEIRFSLENDEILLTAAPLADHRDFLAGAGTFALVNGKIITHIDLEPALRFHRQQGNLATLILLPNRQRASFAHVETDTAGRILEFIPFTRAKQVKQLQVFTGIHLLEPVVLEDIPVGRPYDTVRHLYPALLQRGERVRAFLADGEWREFSTLERYLDHNLHLLQEQALDRLLGQNTAVHDTADLRLAVIGPDAAVGRNAQVHRSVVLARTEIGAGVRLNECLVGPGVRIPAGRAFHRAVIVSRRPAEIPPGMQLEEGLAWRPLANPAEHLTV
ncbi:MAG: NDP-sugar synthase [Acidobacteria bacterium]|nr:NDP-sugar synthase [Acidobacteriota bacterium]